jgi:hypothetical protein
MAEVIVFNPELLWAELVEQEVRYPQQDENKDQDERKVKGAGQEKKDNPVEPYGLKEIVEEPPEHVDKKEEDRQNNGNN